VLVLKVRKIGKSRGVVLPKEALVRLRAGDRSRLLLVETPDGGYCIPPCEQGIARYRSTLRALAG
jgi:hypothetical protein